MPIIIGIDLGTTSCCVGVYTSGKVRIILNTYGNNTTPCYVAFVGEDELFGEEAKNQEVINHRNTIYDFKRLMSQNYEESSVQKDKRRWNFQVIRGKEGLAKAGIKYGETPKLLSSKNLTTKFLKKIIEMVQAKLGKNVNGAVITIPANFKFEQRRDTRRAAQLAGLPLIKLMSVPVAAALAYGLQNSEEGKSHYTLVISIGGRTVDVTVLLSEHCKISVKSTSGLPHLGGDDFTARMVTHFVEEIKEKFHKNITNDKNAICKLRNACEIVKQGLSYYTELTVSADSLLDGNTFTGKMSRNLFETINDDLFYSITDPIHTSLQMAGLKLSDIDHVILIGGSIRIPKIRQIILEYFPKLIVKYHISPTEAAARGAAIQGAKVCAGETETFQGLLVNEFTPLSLGIEWARELISVIVPKNTKLPVVLERQFTTKKDHQTKCRISVYEGDSPLSRNNRLLALFNLNGVTAALVGQTRITVQFSISDDMTLIVTASEVDKEYYTTESIYVLPEGDLNSPGVAELERIAAGYRSADVLERNRIKSRLELETLCIKYRSEVRQLPDISNHERTAKHYQLNKLNDTIDWTFENAGAQIYVYKKKQKEVEDYFANFRLVSVRRTP